jgi:uncharacterized protein (TIGR02145 family)
LSFTTNEASIPKIETTLIDHIMQTNATCYFSILSDSGSVINSKGICWSLNPEPTLADSNIYLEGQDMDLDYVINNLNLNTTYYTRAYAINSVGIAYGNILTFKTLPESGESVLDVDGNEYFTLVIGEQICLDQNLKTTKLNDGENIALLTGNQDWKTTSEPAYCWYNNDENNKEDYGALYNVYVVRTDKICPSGWHVPTYSDFETLINYLKENSITLENAGFGTIDGGYRNYEGPFDYDEESNDLWWLDSEIEDGYNDFGNNFWFYGEISQSAANNNGMSIRCLINLP